MTDRELLELAAKAAGYLNWTPCTEGLHIEMGSRRGGIVHYWNPLADDADALRLAVKLRISILLAETHPHNPECGYVTALDSSPTWSYTTDHNKDPYAATRRAIVSAAAEIGKSMGEQA